MNASEQPKSLRLTIDAMLGELSKLAQNPRTSSDDLYVQSVDILRLLFQPDDVAIFLVGVNGLAINAVSNTEDFRRLSDIGITEQDTSIGSAAKASVVKDELDRSTILYRLNLRGTQKAVLLFRTKPNGFLAIQQKVVEDVGLILNQHLTNRSSQTCADFEKFNQFSSNCLSTLLRDELSEILTNDIRLILGAERSQYFESSGKGCRLANVSSVSRFENRTSLLRSSKKLANGVFRSGTTLLSCNVTEDPKLKALMDEYKSLSGFPFVACFPLYGAGQQDADHEKQARPIGVLLAEYATAPPASKFVEAANFAVPQMSMALENAGTFSSIPMHKTWLSFHRKFKFKRWRKSWLALICLACFLLFVFSWRIDFKIRMTGSLHAVNERIVFSPRDAFVESVLVNHGELVKQGQVLLELRSPELQLALDEAEGEIEKLKDLRSAKKIVLNQASTGKKADRYSSITMAGEIAELDFKIQAQTDKRDFALQQMKDLKVVAPIDGTIVTWDVKKLLHEKPVRWGESLMKVADENQQWQLQFLAPEKSVGYILKAAEHNQNGIRELSVEYFFNSRPQQTFEVSVADVGKSTEQSVSDGLGVRLICSVAPEQQLQRHGAQVTGDVQCGKRSIAFVWTRELVDAIGRHLVW